MEIGTLALPRRLLVGSSPGTIYLTQTPEQSASHGVLNLGGGLFDAISPGSFVGSSGGTVLALNTPSGYGGNHLDLQVAGSSVFRLSGTGAVTAAGTAQGAALGATGLSGATAVSRYVGATASGAPVSGTFATGDYALDQSGNVWICTAGGSPGTWVSGASGGWQKITENVLGSSAASLTFSSIPATYRHLRVVVSGRGDTSADQTFVQMKFNGDTGSNYNHYDVVWNSDVPVALTPTTGGTSNETSIPAGIVPGGNATANFAGDMEILIADYRGTTLFKSTHTFGGDMDINDLLSFNLRHGQGIWLSTAAITSITLTTNSGNFLAGSCFSLYGTL